MEEIDREIREPKIDDTIVRLHTYGESVFHAIARATTVPGVDPLDPALLRAVPEGRVPLGRGKTAELPRLDAAGVAAICTFELEQANYEADRVLVTEPKPPSMPRIDAERFWPILKSAGYRVGATLVPIDRRFKARRVLAERAEINLRTFDRICSGSAKTVAITTGIAILKELPTDSLLGELEAECKRWETATSFYNYDRLEYLEKLSSLAPQLLATADVLQLTLTERAALNDLLIYLREAHREPSTDEHVLTAEERLKAADRWFRKVLGREPVPLSVHLKRHAEHMFRGERNVARGRRRALAKGLAGAVITTPAVYGRTNRLRRAGRLPASSKPQAFRPPADFDDVRPSRR